MANLALDRSDDPAVRGLAFDISATQTNQTGRMQGWLSLWGLQPTGGEHHGLDGRQGGHAGHSMGGNGLMPGMATEEELTNLRDAVGHAEFDVEFLRLMMRHHQGGTEMAEYAAEHADNEAVRDLADSIVSPRRPRPP